MDVLWDDLDTERPAKERRRAGRAPVRAAQSFTRPDSSRVQTYALLSVVVVRLKMLAIAFLKSVITVMSATVMTPSSNAYSAIDAPSSSRTKLVTAVRIVFMVYLGSWDKGGLRVRNDWLEKLCPHNKTGHLRDGHLVF